MFVLCENRNLVKNLFVLASVKDSRDIFPSYWLKCFYSPKGGTGAVPENRYSRKFYRIQRKTLVSESLLMKLQASSVPSRPLRDHQKTMYFDDFRRIEEASNFFEKETSGYVFSGEFCEIFRNIFIYGTFIFYRTFSWN